MEKKGRLFLIPSFLDPSNDALTISTHNKTVINSLRIFIAENLRTARRFLKKADFQHNLNDVEFHELNKHTHPDSYNDFLIEAENGQDIGLLSEAGAPCIADPGAEIVKLAHRKSITVIPLPGMSSIILSLMASGLNGQNFSFIGYLPVDNKQREQKLREIEKESGQFKQTKIFIETPYRNNQLVTSMLKVLNPQTYLCIASEITNPDREYILTKTVSDWKKSIPDLHKKPSVFLIYNG